MSSLEVIPEIGSHPGLWLLLLVGSRATGKAHERSDWDFAYLGDEGFDPSNLHMQLIVGLNTERVDLANLRSSSGVFRYRAAVDGQVLYDADREWERFQLEAISFWFDAAPVLRDAYTRVLERR